MAKPTNQVKGFLESRVNRLREKARNEHLTVLELAELVHCQARLKDQPTNPAFGYAEGIFQWTN